MAEAWKYDCYYVLAAKGIQDFILKGDKLKLMIGGSELVDSLPGKVDEILSAMGLVPEKDYRVLSRAAGGVRILFCGAGNGARFAELVPPALSVYAPGLDFVQAVEEIDASLAEVMERAEKRLAARRNIHFPVFPPAGPLVERSPRSGLPSSGVLKLSGGVREEGDASMMAKLAASGDAKSAVAGKALPPRPDGGQYRLPDSFEMIAARENSFMAIVHIDGNGLGRVVAELFRSLRTMGQEDAAGRYAGFCSALQETTEKSLKEALAPIISEHESRGGPGDPLPLRPLVCAGDDVTVVLQARDAVRFASDFFASFEKHSGEILGGLGIPGLDGHLPLTACAGIAFVKKSFPFTQAYDLCESLCRFAKDRTNRKRSALAFWRLTTSRAEDFGTILERELTAPDNTVLTMMPYSAGSKASGPDAASLIELKEAVEGMPRGALRGLVSELFRGRSAAQQSFERLCEVNSSERAGAGGAKALKKLLGALEGITGGSGGSPLFSGDATPLQDAIELISAEGC